MEYKPISVIILFKFFIVCLVLNCMYFSGQSDTYINMRDARVFAVLDFEQEGFMEGKRIGQYVADELTSSLFTMHQYKVVDRTQVKAAMIDKQVTPSVMSPDEIHELGNTLYTDFLIFGKLIRYDKDEMIDTDGEEFSFQITFRIITNKDGSVIGFFEHQGSGKGEIRNVLNEAIEQMARQVKFK